MKILQILVFIFVFIFVANAQNALLNGTIYDATGALVTSAKVVAVSENGKEFETETDENGNYSLNLPYKIFDNKSSTRFRIAKYEIIVDLENRGFEKYILKDFKFVPSTLGKMFLDIALDSKISEPCGYGGADCLESQEVKSTKGTTVQNKILRKSSEQLSKKENKTKRKNY